MPSRKKLDESSRNTALRTTRKTPKPKLVAVDYEALSSVSRDVQLQEVTLHQAHWNSSPRLRHGGQAKGLSYSFKLVDAMWDLEYEHRVLVVELQYELAAFVELLNGDPQSEREQKDVHMLDLSCNWRVSYRVNESFKPAAAKTMADFAVVNGQLNAFPYVRQFVQDIIGRSGLPPLVLPVYRIPKKRPSSVGKRSPLLTDDQ